MKPKKAPGRFPGEHEPTSCATGPGVLYDPFMLPLPCEIEPNEFGQFPADFDADMDVDQNDFGVFQKCYSGINSPADPTCGN